MTVDFYDLFKKPEPSGDGLTAVVSPIDPARATRYAAGALDDECHKVGSATEGTRNDTLNIAAFSLGQLVAAGHLHRQDVEDNLTAAARTAGLPDHEITATLRSGLNKGQEHPRIVPEQPLTPAPTVLVIDDSIPDSDEVLHATWAPADLQPVLDGTYEPEAPSLMPRDDGAFLLYPGRVHSLHGESESGKSLVAQGEAARLLQLGHDVLYIDFEADKESVTGRLLELGAPPSAIGDHARFRYVFPEVDPRKFAHEREAVATLLARSYSLAVIDGVTDALGIFGQSTKDNDDITAFMRLVPRTIARKTGAAVLLIDHVSKDTENRGRFAIGGQAKMAALDGAAYIVEVAEALGRGRRGVVTLRVGKDRPGGVRAHAGSFRKLDRTQEAARVLVDSTTPDRIDMTVMAPKHGEEGLGQAAEFRPTRLMEEVSRWVEQADEPMSTNLIVGGVGRKRETVMMALSLLVRDHFVRVETGVRKATLHSSIQPYREAQDRASDRFVPPVTPLVPTGSPLVPGTSETSGSRFPSSVGDGNHSSADEEQSVVPGTSREQTGHTPSDHYDVACRKCHRPIPNTIADTTGQLCSTCFTYPEESA